MNIYISGLSYGINDADLNELFSAYGETSSAKVIMDRESGRSRGFGFVEMTSIQMDKRQLMNLTEQNTIRKLFQ